MPKHPARSKLKLINNTKKTLFIKSPKKNKSKNYLMICHFSFEILMLHRRWSDIYRQIRSESDSPEKFEQHLFAKCATKTVLGYTQSIPKPATNLMPIHNNYLFITVLFNDWSHNKFTYLLVIL